MGLLGNLLLAFHMAAGLCRGDGPTDRHVVVISVDGLAAYLLDDPQASLPHIRRLAQEGTAASAGMRVSNPSVTWPNHTTLMTGVHPDRHGVLFNGLAVEGGLGLPMRIDPQRDQQDLVHVPLLFDVLADAEFSSAAINWPCTRGSTTIADNFPDVPDALEHSTPRLLEDLRAAGVLTAERERQFGKLSGVVRDEIWTEAACLALRERRPRLLCLHLLNVDAVHHKYGPQTPAGYSAVANADALVGRVLRCLDETGLRAQTAVFIVADHGFTTIPRTLLPNALLRREGLLTAEGDKVATARVHVIPEGGIGMLYFTNRETASQDREAVLRLFRGVEGIERVVEPQDFPEYHLPSPDDHPGMADLVLSAKDGYGFGASAAGDELVIPSSASLGTHGFLSTFPKMNAVLVISGAGVKRGAELVEAENVDVAPTVARLLGLSLKEADGRVLDEILD